MPATPRPVRPLTFHATANAFGRLSCHNLDDVLRAASDDRRHAAGRAIIHLGRFLPRGIRCVERRVVVADGHRDVAITAAINGVEIAVEASLTVASPCRRSAATRPDSNRPLRLQPEEDLRTGWIMAWG
jgi:hypothetical protein